MNYSKWRKRLKIISPLSGVLMFIIVGIIIYFSFSNGEIDFDLLLKRLGILFSILAVIIVLIVLLVTINFNRNIKNTCEEKRFKYLDTFFYGKWEIRLERTEYNYYHVIEDIFSKKKYVIINGSPEVHEALLPGYRIDILAGTGLATNWKKKSFNDEGSYWVKEEVNDFYKKDNNYIILNFDEKFVYYKDIENEKEFDKEKSLFKKIPVLYNSNPDIDASILEDATFFVGLIEFDNKEN